MTASSDKKGVHRSKGSKKVDRREDKKDPRSDYHPSTGQETYVPEYQSRKD